MKGVLTKFLFLAFFAIFLCHRKSCVYGQRQNFQFYVIFAAQNSEPRDDDHIGEDDLEPYSSVSTRVFEQTSRQTRLLHFQIAFNSFTQKPIPSEFAKLTSLLTNNIVEPKKWQKSFIIVIGQGSALQQSLVAVALWRRQTQWQRQIQTLVYDSEFFNYANALDHAFQMNQDRQNIVAPLLASVVLHKSHPKGGFVVLIHDINMAADQLYIAAHSLFNTLVLVSDDQTEDVVTCNLRNEIAPIVNNALVSPQSSSATFVIHVRSSQMMAKIFSAAKRINLFDDRFVWIVADRSVVLARGRDSDGEFELKEPIRLFMLPNQLVALDINRRFLFRAALSRILHGLAVSSAKAVKRKYRNLNSVSIEHLFEKDGSILDSRRRGGRRFYADDARYLSPLQVFINRQGELITTEMSLRSINNRGVQSPGSLTMSTKIVPTVKAEDDKIVKAIIQATTEAPSGQDMVIVDKAAFDDLVPNLLQVYISLGPPFLFEKPLSSTSGDCVAPSAVICDRIDNDWRGGNTNPVVSHQCCSGLVPDVVRALSKDLKINARIVVSAARLSVRSNSSLALDLLNKKIVDMVFTQDPFIGKKSLSKYYVTDPFYTSSYAMMVSIRRKEPSLYAFLSPFPLSVWLGIIVMLAPVTALAMSQFEWNSPFGLNPWGRRRKTNYTLGSALNMVYVLLFGHTVKTKCPKAWPSKWTQNFWAGFAIFVIASYTGNLASFLARRHESIEIDSVYDLESLNLNVAVVRDDPIYQWLQSAAVGLANKLTVVDSFDDAVNRLRSYEFDVLIGEQASLRYWQITQDATACSTKLLPRTFADRDLAPALLVDSQFRATVAGKMREYKTIGEFQQLISKNRFVSLPLQGTGNTACGTLQGESLGLGGGDWARTAAETQLTLNHANGLFLAMAVAIVLCCFILIAEHMTFYWVVPKLRTKKRTSFWRGFTLMYLSQRLYRIINSEELLQPSQVLREMLDVIKKLEFSRIFQKSARTTQFRKVTIAEFVQQVKDEKEKNLPNVVVQTKGLNRAKKALKKSPKKGIHEVPTTCLLDTMAAEKESTESKQTVIESKSPSKVGRYKRQDLSKKRASVDVIAMKNQTETRLTPEAGPRRWKTEPIVFEPISGFESPGERWAWLRARLTSKREKERKKAMVTVLKEEMDKMHEGKVKLEETVRLLCKQLEETKKERDRLLLVNNINDHETSV